ncbi:hypothetical protein P692DRAFT_201810068 [Suillus brevipes Sb2]|nr:hypothetical protein P692DRAFT_201810068 [Suillus brevipes Sb2]
MALWIGWNSACPEVPEHCRLDEDEAFGAFGTSNPPMIAAVLPSPRPMFSDLSDQAWGGRANVGETTILQRGCITWKKQHGWAKLESADTMDYYSTTKEAGRWFAFHDSCGFEGGGDL